jgi:hypothetical protein
VRLEGHQWILRDSDREAWLEHEISTNGTLFLRVDAPDVADVWAEPFRFQEAQKHLPSLAQSRPTAMHNLHLPLHTGDILCSFFGAWIWSFL